MDLAFDRNSTPSFNNLNCSKKKLFNRKKCDLKTILPSLCMARWYSMDVVHVLASERGSPINNKAYNKTLPGGTAVKDTRQVRTWFILIKMKKLCFVDGEFLRGHKVNSRNINFVARCSGMFTMSNVSKQMKVNILKTSLSQYELHQLFLVTQSFENIYVSNNHLCNLFHRA